MQRRHFVQRSALAGASLLTASLAKAQKTQTPAANTPFHLDYAFHDGMFKNSAGDNFIEQIKFAYDLGFRSIEDNGLTSRPVDMQQKIGDMLASLGMKMGVFVVDKGGNGANSLAAGKQEYIDIFLT